jgi:hypothetical protein
MRGLQIGRKLFGQVWAFKKKIIIIVIFLFVLFWRGGCVPRSWGHIAPSCWLPGGLRVQLGRPHMVQVGCQTITRLVPNAPSPWPSLWRWSCHAFVLPLLASSRTGSLSVEGCWPVQEARAYTRVVAGAIAPFACSNHDCNYCSTYTVAAAAASAVMVTARDHHVSTPCGW